VSNADAKAAALEWLTQRQWPDDLTGYVVQLVEFPSDEAARFFYPAASPGFFAMVTRALNRRCRTRGAKVVRVALLPEHYEAGRGTTPDTPDARLAYAEAAQRILHGPQ
jgi:hypothetical protein